MHFDVMARGVREVSSERLGADGEVLETRSARVNWLRLRPEGPQCPSIQTGSARLVPADFEFR